MAKNKIKDKKIETSMFQLLGGVAVIVILVLLLGVVGVGIILVLSGLFWWLAFAGGIKSTKEFIKKKTA